MKLKHYLLSSLAAMAAGTSLLSPHTLDAAGPRIAEGGQRRSDAQEQAWKHSGSNAETNKANPSPIAARP